MAERPDRSEAAHRLIVRAAILLCTIRRTDHIAQSMCEAAGLWRGEEFARAGAVLGVFPELAASALARDVDIQERIDHAAATIIEQHEEDTPAGWVKLATATARALGVGPAEVEEFIGGALPLSEAFEARSSDPLHQELREIDRQRVRADADGRDAEVQRLNRRFAETLDTLERKHAPGGQWGGHA